MIRTFALTPLAALAMACSQTPTVNNSAEAPAPDAAEAPMAPPPANAEAPAEPTGDLEMVCDAAAVQDLVGKAYTDAAGQDAQGRSKSRSVRVIRPGTAVTMDYRVDRLNIELDASDRITAIRCG